MCRAKGKKPTCWLGSAGPSVHRPLVHHCYNCNAGRRWETRKWAKKAAAFRCFILRCFLFVHSFRWITTSLARRVAATRANSKRSCWRVYGLLIEGAKTATFVFGLRVARGPDRTSNGLPANSATFFVSTNQRIAHVSRLPKHSVPFPFMPYLCFVAMFSWKRFTECMGRSLLLNVWLRRLLVAAVPSAPLDFPKAKQQ